MGFLYNSGIYRLIFSNGKFYIGQTINLKNRMRNYKYIHCKGQLKLYNAIKKYNWHSIKVDILIYTSDIDIMNWWEIFYIKQFNSTINGYNIESGGKNAPCSEKNKVYLRSLRLGTKMPEETKKKISESLLGEKNHFYGKHHSPESLKKMSSCQSARSKILKNDKIIKSVIDLYNSGLSFRQCAKILNIGRTSVEKILKTNNVVRRTKLAANKERFKNGRK